MIEAPEEAVEIKVFVDVALEAEGRRVKKAVSYTMRDTEDTGEQTRALMHAVFGVFPTAMRELAEALES
jgi:hypothetical protein